MSSTPIFDATLADAPRNIWEASPIFLPTVAIQIPAREEPFTDWSIYAYRHIVTMPDPANLSFLRTADA